jgi:hypothetical protein
MASLSIYIARLMQGGDRHIERHDGVSDMPEYRLLEALLEEAVITYLRGKATERAWLESARWLQQEATPNYSVNLCYDGVTFSFVCDQLSLDESYIRKSVFALREKSLKSIDSAEQSAV